MSNCCPPVQTGQKEEARIAVESCCTLTIAGNSVADAAPTNLCPGCHQKGKKVDPMTLKAMLDVSLLALRDLPYLFCRTATCPVVYFSANGTQSFIKDQIRVPVHQKEPDDDAVPVCYCFRHSPATIRAEWLATDQTTVIEEIEGGIKAGQCACEIRNPQGSCCLGNVSAVVKRVTQVARIPA
jgi:hypothetical protein